VIAAANTGNDNNNNHAVIKTDQTKSGIRYIDIAGARILMIVDIKLIAPNNDDIPAKCNENIAKSTDGPECAIIDDNGGYTVHPVPAPTSTKDEKINNVKDGGNNQKLTLFNLGNAISGAPISNGTNQFPNPPIITGITMKKIMMNACAVIIVLYS